MSIDLTKLLENDEFFARTNSQGIVEVVSERTGQIIAMQKTMEDLLRNKSDQLVEYICDDGTKVYIQKGLPSELIPKHQVIYSTTIADIICQKIAEGATITSICEDDKMPNYSTLTRWRKAHEDFSEMFEQALKDRAHIYHDKAIDAAEAAVTKDDAAVQSLKMNAYKWGAEKGNPDRFGTRTKITGDNTGHGFVILTGVPQPDEEKDVTPKEPQLEQSSEKEAPPEETKAEA